MDQEDYFEMFFFILIISIIVMTAIYGYNSESRIKSYLDTECQKQGYTEETDHEYIGPGTEIYLECDNEIITPKKDEFTNNKSIRCFIQEECIEKDKWRECTKKEKIPECINTK